MTPCIHKWLIEPAKGPQSEGICARCEERRMFRNSLDHEDEVRATQREMGPKPRRIHRKKHRMHNMVVS